MAMSSHAGDWRIAATHAKLIIRQREHVLMHYPLTGSQMLTLLSAGTKSALVVSGRQQSYAMFSSMFHWVHYLTLLYRANITKQVQIVLKVKVTVDMHNSFRLLKLKKKKKSLVGQ